ncbi:MAG: hypothetical protein K1X57_10940 [Gemmataceae bacterium]|nr:hypothetical protein [Gemmataceae bacterium]
MGLVDPVKIYSATSNLESQLICRVLQGHGIEAFAGEDVSPAGIWVGGTIPGVFDAGVFVSRADANQAYEIIQEHERLEAERSGGKDRKIEATCEECGKSAAFSTTQRGTVQNCPHCGGFMDVSETDPSDSWSAEYAGEEDRDRTTE